MRFLSSVSILILLFIATAADALQCKRPDGSKFSCFCDDKDGQEQFAAVCADKRPSNRAVR